DALERLLRMNYLKKSAKGKITLVEENTTTIGPEVAVPATRNQQTQILEMALQALIEIPIELRSQTSSTMAIPSDRLGEAKEVITEFRRKMASLMQRPGKRDSVYQLSISFYPLTKTNS
ncbi:MAG TPA: TIGR02147 family protein, partial [Bdellovibrio sp.]|nr:TIGR02147 family protein [Bdellovibrio sp.]